MRPRIEGKEHIRVIELVDNIYNSLSPTQLIELLINNHYESLYPSGEEIEQNGNIEEIQTGGNK